MLSLTFCEALADNAILVLSMVLGALALIGSWVVCQIAREEWRRGVPPPPGSGTCSDCHGAALSGICVVACEGYRRRWKSPDAERLDEARALVERLRDAGNALAEEAADAIGYAPEWAREKWGAAWGDAIAAWNSAALAAADGTDSARDDGQGGT